MPLEDLQKAGLILPEDQWGKRDLTSDVRRVPLLLSATSIPAWAALMYIGDGGWITWIGIILFFAFLSAFTWLSLRGITGNGERRL